MDTRVAPSEANSALAKALSVVDVLLSEGRPLPLAEIARRLGVPRQTTHRLVNQLEASGLLRREPARQYYGLGPRLLGLGVEVLRSAWQSGPVRAIMAELVERVGETCNLGVLDRDTVVYIERVECDWPLRVQLRPGSRVPLHATAIGKLLVANLPSRARRRILAAVPLTRYTANTLTDPDTLERQMREIRKQGYSLNDEENLDGVIGLAVPVEAGEGKVIAGLSLHAPSLRMSLVQARAHLSELRRAAAKIEAQVALMSK